MKLTIAQNEAWQAQAKSEAMAWHTAKGALPEQGRDRDTYSVGFSAGWQMALQAFKLHGLIK